MKTAGVQSKADHFISTSKLSIPRGIDINHQTRASKRNRIAEHARKDVKRLCRLSTKAVLLLSEVTLNLAVLKELEVLLCMEYIG